MTKRVFALLLTLVMVIGMFPVTALAAENIELTVWGSFDERPWLNEQLAAFEEANPQWRISWIIEEYETYESCEMLYADPAAGADVFFFGDDWLLNLIWADALMPLPQEDAAHILAQTSQAVLDCVTDQDGTCYAFPLSADTILLYYNKAIYSAEDVTSRDTRINKAPVAYPLNLATDVASFYLANGCTMFGASGKNEAAGFRFNGTRGTAVTRYLAELTGHKNFRNDVDSLGHWGLWQGELGASFLNYQAYDFLYEMMGDNLGVAPLPSITIDGQPRQMKAHSSAYCIGVNRHTDHADAARALARFLTRSESQMRRWELNKAPIYPTYPVASELINDPAIRSHAGIRNHLETLNTIAYHTPYFSGMNLLWQYNDLLVQWLLNGEITPENAAALTEEWNTLINGGVTPPIFSDVTPGSYYEEPVEWAVENGITYGLTETEFGTKEPCKRSQVVTFLWRAAGSPAPKSTAHSFVDVKKGSFYEKAVLWAVENGITVGTDTTHFDPDLPCTRAQVVTFLWRAAGKPAASGEIPFKDVPASKWYAQPVLWAVQNGITYGMTDTEFDTDGLCTRAQVVTFLYRVYN